MASYGLGPGSLRGAMTLEARRHTLIFYSPSFNHFRQRYHGEMNTI